MLTLGNMSGSHTFIACAAVAGRSSTGIFSNFLIHLLSSPENSSTDGRSWWYFFRAASRFTSCEQQTDGTTPSRLEATLAASENCESRVDKTWSRKGIAIVFCNSPLVRTRLDCCDVAAFEQYVACWPLYPHALPSEHCDWKFCQSLHQCPFVPPCMFLPPQLPSHVQPRYPQLSSAASLWSQLGVTIICKLSRRWQWSQTMWWKLQSAELHFVI